MAQVLADRRDIDFVLYEQFGTQEMLKNKQFEGLNKKTVDLIVNEARQFAVSEILPTYAEGDRNGVSYEAGQVRVPECYRRPFKLFVENEWTALTEDPEVGGQGLPHIVATAANEFLVGANFAFASYLGLGHGVGKMIELYGTEEQKRLFLKNLYTGHWAGTMLLTEPQAGSDVGALTTTAVPNGDGTYSISGNKIFITAGDHDLTENIIHPVLARIEGAPPGTKGISLFLVPKYWVNEDGSLGEFNDVVCTGIEHKMGLHGSATCSLTLGGKGNCRGMLLGEANKGMRIMFHMMNEARLGVGAQAFMHASAAYLYALNYARERLQGRALEDFMNPDAPQVSIIQHPDVRRMLLWMKAHVDGMRSFVYFIAHCFDQAAYAQSEETREKYQGLVDLLTPVLKSYNANRGFEVCIQAIQVYGGYGYTQEYPVEQILRDCKIASIYEGTDGIQAMDLLARKLGMKKGAIFMGFMQEVQGICAQAKGFTGLQPLGEDMEKVVNRLGEVALGLGKLAMSENFKTAFAHSFPFLEAFGDVVLGWMLLWRAVLAQQRLEQGVKKKEQAFYQGQLKTARFYIKQVLPLTMGRMNAVALADQAAVEISEDGFGG